MTTAERIALLRKIAPEFGDKADDEIEVYLDIYSDFVSSSYFGTLYDKALCFYTAHRITVAGIAADEGAESSALTAGAITSEKEGDLQRSYASSTTTSDTELNSTYYGKMYLEIQKMRKPIGLTRIAL